MQLTGETILEKGRHIKILLIFLVIAFSITSLNQVQWQAEHIEPQDDSLVVTVLKQQYWQAENKQATGGLTESEEYDIEVIVYPEWEISPPLYCYRVTQYYYTYHRGIDLVPGDCKNYAILSVAEGKIIKARYDGGYGYRIEILHENGIISTYSHLSKMNFKVGALIGAGVEIGTMGSTGYSTGRHLHFEIIYSGQKLDPKIYLK